MLFAEKHLWPDSLDLAITFLLLGAMIALTVSGHVLMVLDIRAWIRSLRRALIVVADHLPHFPRWSRQQTPRCLAAMGLRLPCNQEQLLRAYRNAVKKLHPDRGGDRKRFMRLQADFEESLAFLERQIAGE
jgi:hypothetical protein